MATVQDIYNVVCNRLSEPGGLVLNLATEAEFLRHFADVVQDFCHESGCSKAIFTQMIALGQSEYIIPDRQLRVEHAFVGGKIIQKVTIPELDALLRDWRTVQDIPAYYHEDGLAIKKVEIVPAPNYQGTNVPGSGPPYGVYGNFYPSQRNLTTVGSQRPSDINYTLGTTITGVPASALQYLTWGVLSRMLTSDSELRDEQRAAYATARYREGISLFRSALLEDLEDAD